ncbi:hypothetical protein EIK77_008470 [Talaromyces pinophilus]|nr:hypothetical protein EIK77_008470 [Talaromyces pinophilus]
MDINLLLNGVESETGVSTSVRRSLKDEPIQAPLLHSAELEQQSWSQSHCICPPQRRIFSPQEDALMQDMIDNIQSGRVRILSMSKAEPSRDQYAVGCP